MSKAILGGFGSDVTYTGADGKTSKFTQPNIHLFTKGHFSIIRVEGDKSRSTDSWTTMTREQLIDTFGGRGSNSDLGVMNPETLHFRYVETVEVNELNR